MTAPGFMLATISRLISFGAGRPGISAVVMTMILVLDVIGDQLGLLLLVLGRHRLGVAGSRLRLLELFVLDRDELGAERGDLLLGGGSHVGCRNDGAEPAGGCDGLEAGDADAHDEALAGGHGARCRHHHRHGLAEHRGGVDDGLVAGEVRLAGQHVHRLRPRDARHELHGEDRGVAGRRGFEPGTLVVRRDHRGDESARLQRGELVGRRPADLQQNVGARDGLRGAGRDVRSCGAQHVVREARAVARTGLHLHGATVSLQLLHSLGRNRDAGLIRPFRRDSYGDHERL